MFDRFMRTLTGPCGVRQGDKVLVCCSGGIDSMVLLRLMVQAREPLALDLHVVTVDHGLRCEAPGDAEFVLEQCRGVGVAATLCRLQMNPHQPNLEEEARIRRYAAIAACREEHGARLTATGHTLDDQAETVIYRLIRGTGPRGVQGMDYRRDDGLIRPMLDITRAEVEVYARAYGIPYVTDQTNADTTLVRNRIRKQILPLMREINPGVVEALGRFARIAREEGAVLQDQTVALGTAALEMDWGICRVFDGDLLRAAPPAVLKRLLITVAADMLGEPRGIAAAEVEGLLAVVHGTAGAYTLKRRMRVEQVAGRLVFSPAAAGPYYAVSVAGPGAYDLTPIRQGLRLADAPPGSVIRTCLPGDRMGRRTVAQILADKRVIEPLRRFWPVLVSADRVIGVGGIRDERWGPYLEFPV